MDYFCHYLVRKPRRHLICRICKFQLRILIYLLIFKIKLELSFMQFSIASSAVTLRHLPRCSSSIGMTTGKSTSQDMGSKARMSVKVWANRRIQKERGKKKEKKGKKRLTYPSQGGHDSYEQDSNTTKAPLEHKKTFSSKKELCYCHPRRHKLSLRSFNRGELWSQKVHVALGCDLKDRRGKLHIYAKQEDQKYSLLEWEGSLVDKFWWGTNENLR